MRFLWQRSDFHWDGVVTGQRPTLADHKMNPASLLWTILNGVTLFFWASAAYHGRAFLFKIRLFATYSKRVPILLWHKYIRKSVRVKHQLQQVNALPDDAEVLQEREVYFVRHAESTWNEMINRGFAPQILLPKLVGGIAFEAFLLSTGNPDSKIVDAPICAEGINQAASLREFLADEENYEDDRDWRVLNGYDGANGARAPTSVLVSSNLRRSLSTMLLGFQDRFHRRRTVDKLLVNPFLQETAINADCVSLHPRTKAVTSPTYNASSFDPPASAMLYQQFIGEETQPASENVLGDEQLMQFADWLFTQQAPTNNTDGDGEDSAAAVSRPSTFIVGGHSHWFRRFFQLCLPRPSEAGTVKDAQTLKIENGGVMAFTLQQLRVGDTVVYRVVQDSLRNVFKEFDRSRVSNSARHGDINTETKKTN